MIFQTLVTRRQGPVCYLRIDRPDAGNTINRLLVSELRQALDDCRGTATVVVLEGGPEVFCAGADFGEIAAMAPNGSGGDPAPLYDLWLDLATGPYATVAHVRGNTNAGGVGFVAACDVVIADPTARFSLSELLFGLLPACVLPFLIRRVGAQPAHHLALTTQPITAQEALRHGLVDAMDPNSQDLLRRYVRRLSCLSKPAIADYKRYLGQLYPQLAAAREVALAANRAAFAQPRNLEAIARYVSTGELPWERRHDGADRG